MNNINLLKDELNLSFRKLEKYVGISNSNLTRLSTEERPFRQKHIDILTNFFNVTSDYLLGKSKNGYQVFPELDVEPVFLDEAIYYKLKDKITCKIIEDPNIEETNIIDIEFGKEKIPFVNGKYFVYRELKGSINDYNVDFTINNELYKLINTLNEEQVKKVIKFIEDYIK